MPARGRAPSLHGSLVEQFAMSRECVWVKWLTGQTGQLVKGLQCEEHNDAELTICGGPPIDACRSPVNE